MSTQERPFSLARTDSNNSHKSTASRRSAEIPSIFSSNQIPQQRPASPTKKTSKPVLEGLSSPRASQKHAGNRQRSGSLAEPPLISPDAPDRVFPIRSYVTVTPSSTNRENYFSTPAGRRSTSRKGSTQRQETSNERIREQDDDNSTLPPPTPASDFETDLLTQTRKSSTSTDVASNNNVRASGQGYQIVSDNDSIRSGSVRSVAPSNFRDMAERPSLSSQKPPSLMSGVSNRDADDSGGYLTARFKHVVTADGHAVITGRDGETLQRCEDEPIHIPGAVQSFGLLIALQEQAEGKFLVRIVSENSKRVLGYAPKQLFKLDNFLDVLSEDQAENFLDHVDFIREGEDDVEVNGPEVFTMSIKDPARRSHKFWTAIHINQKNPDLIICEFELEDDQVYPLTPLNDTTPEPPEDTLSSDPTEAEYRESTETKSRPLRVLRSARKRKGEQAAMEVFNIMSQVQEQLGEAPNLDAFLKVLVGVVKELTGFHRVMVYQFDSQWNGKVVTELVDPRATKDLYKGLHFPASDIPAQAREMYKVNKVRLLYDRDQETSRLVCRTVDDLKTPLDLTHSYLRAMSPIHIKYLQNMAVRSSMSISINAFNELWGLISCHCYGQKGTRVSFPIRKMCRLVGDSASRNIERLSYASRLQARKLINTAPTKHNPSGYIIASSDDLLKLFDADFGLLSINEETKILGKIEGTQEALALLEYLRVRQYNSVITSQDIRFDFRDLKYPPGFKTVAGCLIVPLSSSGRDFIVFLRKGQLREVKWAGNPYEKYVKEGTEGYLEPRKSFKTWSETVVGKCREWTEEEIETAAVLCLVYGKFIEVWRQKEAALQNSQLTKLLLANSAHEVRTPLNAIINYLEIAMEGALDEETRDNLSRSHSASKSLIYVINDLLDLTKTESGGELVHEEPFNLRQTFKEASEMFVGDLKRKDVAYNVKLHDDVPEHALGDQRRVHRAISNIIANAVTATSSGQVDVEMLVGTRYDALRIEVEVIVTDTGVGMSSAKLDTLFAELEQVQAEHSTLIEDAIAPEAKSLTDGKENKQALGLGLAIVARIISNMNGQLRLKSEEGKGSRFVLQLPFVLPQESNATQSTAVSTSAASESMSDPFESQSEVTLVPKYDRRDSQSSSGTSSPARRNSAESMRSMASGNSRASAISQRSQKSIASSMRSARSGTSGRSDVDRLIEAMQEPYMVSSQPQSPAGQDAHRKALSSGSSNLTRSPHSHDGVMASRSLPEHKRSLRAGTTPDGQFEVAGSGQRGRAVRVPDYADDRVESAQATPKHRLVEADPIEAHENEKSSESPSHNDIHKADHMKVLIAEDDPINAKIIQKRLRKVEHETHLTVNGEECASLFGEKSGIFDVILMDMQMPIVDGLSSAKMIRSYEKSTPHCPISPRAALNGRVPIIAVSASLVEKDRQTYIDGGFDGWILKPINFNRLAELMKGIVDSKIRAENVYQTGTWEKGGWFSGTPAESTAAKTSPAPEKEMVYSPEADITQEACTAQADADSKDVTSGIIATGDKSQESQEAREEAKSEEPTLPKPEALEKAIESKTEQRV